jgi:hypothetical protein
LARTKDPKKGRIIFTAVRDNKPVGIGFREIKRRTSLANNTIVRWIGHFQTRNFTYKDSRNKIYVRENMESEVERDLKILKQSKRSKRRILPGNRSTGKRVKDNSKQRRDYAFCLISTVAAIGNASWNRTTDHGYGFISMIDMKTSSDINFVSRPLIGIGISDFGKKDKEGITSMLDTRTFVDFNERFSYLNLSDQEVKLYINKLCNHDPPILKEITVLDYEFLCFVYDSNRPDFIILERKDLNIYARNTIRLTLDIDKDGDNSELPLIHEINYDIHQDKITSRILIDVNSEDVKKILKLDTFYDSSNNFSISIWGEKRYIIADPVLREFIEICNIMFEAVYRKMEQLYSLNLLSKNVRGEYIKWYQSIYGPFRRGAEILQLDRIAVSRIKQYIKKIKAFEKQGKNEEKKKIIEELDYACRYRMWGPYEKTGNPFNKDFATQDLKKVEKRLKQINENSHNTIDPFGNQIEKYHNQLMSQKYKAIRQKYSNVIQPLLDLSYPDFIVSYMTPYS